MKAIKSIAYKKVSDYQYQALVDNVETQFSIINKSLGLSSNGRNEYYLINSKTHKNILIGTLSLARRCVARLLINRDVKNVG